MIQERLERDLASLRSSAREREERLLADQERLQRDLATVKQRFDAEKDSELRRVKVENEADLARHKEAAERANAELQRLRAVCGALEQQAASSVAQINELKSSSEELNKTQEYYKAEFVVLQRKWVEREKEIRAEASAQSLQMLEAEKTRLKILAQDELNTRASKIADQLRQENDVEKARLEAKLRAEIEQELLARRQELKVEADAVRIQADAETSRLRRELAAKDAAWAERLLAKETEVLASRSRADEAAGRLSREEEARQAADRRVRELEKAVSDAREQAGGLSASQRELQRRLGETEAEKSRLEREKTELERLTSAQAAQVSGVQEALEQARLQLTRETLASQIAQSALDKLKKGGA